MTHQISIYRHRLLTLTMFLSSIPAPPCLFRYVLPIGASKRWATRWAMRRRWLTMAAGENCTNQNPGPGMFMDTSLW